MATPLDEDSVYECTSFGVQDGQAIRNVVHYCIVGGAINPAQDTVEALATFFRDNWMTWLPRQVDTFVLLQVAVVEITGRTATAPRALLYGAQATDAPGAGTGEGALAADPLPTYAAVGVQKLTAKRGRRYRGSMRIGGVPEQDTDENLLTAVALPLWQAVADGLDGPGTPAGMNVQLQMGVFAKRSFLLSVGAPPVKTFWEPITALDVSPIISSQTSRKRRRKFGA